MQNIGQYIRELRIKKGIGSQELASFLDIPPETLLLIETNRIHATKNRVFSIAAYLGADENDLLRTYQRSIISSEIADNRKFNEAFLITGDPYVVPEVSKRHRRMIHDLMHLFTDHSRIKISMPSFPLNNWIETGSTCSKVMHTDTFR